MKIEEIEAIVANAKFAELDRNALYLLVVDKMPVQAAEEITRYLNEAFGFHCIVLPIPEARLFQVER